MGLPQLEVLPLLSHLAARYGPRLAKILGLGCNPSTILATVLHGRKLSLAHML
jgi:hypothetical protein